MDIAQLKNVLEAALFSANQPLSIDRMVTLFLDDAQPSRDELRAALDQLREDYASRGVELQEVSSGFRFQSRQDYAPWVARLWEERPQKYSRALLETLALIAYRQPITRAEIEDIRGVTVSSHIVKTLEERGWVRVVGHKEVPGRPALLATTREFLDYFNLKALDQLPPLAEIRSLEDVLSPRGADVTDLAIESDADADAAPEATAEEIISEANAARELSEVGASASNEVGADAEPARPADQALH
jgi:segregation and condensation protein B